MNSRLVYLLPKQARRFPQLFHSPWVAKVCEPALMVVRRKWRLVVAFVSQRRSGPLRTFGGVRDGREMEVDARTMQRNGRQAQRQQRRETMGGEGRAYVQRPPKAEVAERLQAMLR